MDTIQKNDISEVKIVKRNRFLTIWLIPLAAVAIGMWLLLQNYLEGGIVITITYKSGDGIIANETLVKFGGVEIGKVNDIVISDDKTGVVVTATIKRNAKDFTREGSQFWLVGPRISPAGVSGLSTLISGNYVTVRPGKGEYITAFTGLDQPPFRSADAKGLSLILKSDKVGSLSEGAPILFREIKIGEVEYHNLSDDHKHIEIHAYVYEKYVSLINNNTRFWNISGASFSADMNGIKLKAGSLATIIAGGITFETPDTDQSQEKVKNETIFKLYEDRESAMADVVAETSGLKLVLTSDELGSLSQGSPVYYRKIKVGEILEHELSKDNESVFIYMNIFEEYAFLVQENTRFWNASGVKVSGGLSGLKVRTPSLMALIRGGVCLETPDKGATGTPVNNGAVFKLYDDYESAMEKGAPITISFKNGVGLKADSTVIKYKGMVVGKVKTVELNKKKNGVTVSALLDESARDLARQGSKFYLVGATFNLVDGVKGIDTLISGQYIEVQQGKGRQKKHFKGLEKPPEMDPSIPGLHIVLKTDKLRTLVAKTPVYYKDIQVGKLQRIALSEDKEGVDLYLFIYENYANLVQENTRFWNTSGIDASVGFSGVDVETKPLVPFIWGGISFSTPGLDLNNTPVKNGTVFTLYNDYKSAMAKGVHINIAFTSANGLKPGFTLIKHKGMTIGKVEKVTFTESKDNVVATAFIEKGHEDFAKKGSRFWLVGPKFDFVDGATGLDTILTGGYIQVLPGEGPITASFVALADRPVGLSDYPLKIVLSTKKLGSLSVGAPVYYRQIDVGKITGYRLSETSNNIEVDISIKGQYRPLVRENSRFWNASGVNFSFNMFKIDFQFQSIKSIIAGGIAFATPNNDSMGKEVESGAIFALHDKPSKSWLRWKPAILLKSEDNEAIASK